MWVYILFLLLVPARDWGCHAFLSFLCDSLDKTELVVLPRLKLHIFYNNLWAAHFTRVNMHKLRHTCILRYKCCIHMNVQISVSTVLSINLSFWLLRGARARGSQRDVVYLGRLIAPSYTSPKFGGGGVAVSQPVIAAVHTSCICMRKYTRSYDNYAVSNFRIYLPRELGTRKTLAMMTSTAVSGTLVPSSWAATHRFASLQ